MSGYVPEVGDRARVVLEGEVTHHDDDFFIVGDYGVSTSLPEVVSVEKVTPPLPTTPGSVIWWLDSFVHLTGGGKWVDDNGDSIEGPGVDSFRLHGFEVIFDAGAES